MLPTHASSWEWIARKWPFRATTAMCIRVRRLIGVKPGLLRSGDATGFRSDAAYPRVLLGVDRQEVAVPSDDGDVHSGRPLDRGEAGTAPERGRHVVQI